MAQNRKLKVLTTSQQVIQLEVPSDISIGEVKQILMLETSIPIERQRLFYMGKQIPVQSKLSDIIKQDGQTIQLMPTMENIHQQPPSQQQLAQNIRVPNLGFSDVIIQPVSNNPEQNWNIFAQDNQIPVQQQQETQFRNIFGLPPNVFQQQRNQDRQENTQNMFQLQPNQPNIFRQQSGQNINIFEQQHQGPQYSQQPQNNYQFQQYVPNTNFPFDQSIIQPPPNLLQQRQQRIRPQQYQRQSNQLTYQQAQLQINQFNRFMDQMMHSGRVFPGPPLPVQNTNQIIMMGDLLSQVAFSLQRAIPLIQRTADLLLREQQQVSSEQRGQTQQMTRQTATLIRYMTTLLNIQELLYDVELVSNPHSGFATFRNL